MKWSEYYEKYDDWQESMQYSKLDSITDFGPETSPSSEIADCIQWVDERTANQIIKVALKSGVRFAACEVTEIIECVTVEDGVLGTLLRRVPQSTFSAEHLERIYCSCNNEDAVLSLIDHISQKPNYFNGKELISLCEALLDENLIKQLLLNSKTKFSKEDLKAICDLWVDEEIIRKILQRSGITYSSLWETEIDCHYSDKKRSKNNDGIGKWKPLVIIAGIITGLSGNNKK